MIIHKCDKCGKPLDGETMNLLKLSKFADNSVPTETKYFDLCDDCKVALESWFKGGEKADDLEKIEMHLADLYGALLSSLSVQKNLLGEIAEYAEKD